jgi:glycosyltransferase involved in cell wall biosynthesis
MRRLKQSAAVKTRAGRRRRPVKLRRKLAKTKKHAVKSARRKKTLKSARPLRLKKSSVRTRSRKRKGRLSGAARKKGKTRRAGKAKRLRRVPPAEAALQPAESELRAEPPEEPEDEQQEQGEPGFRRGVNLIGFLRAELGLGESVRLAARSLSAVNMPFGILDYKEVISEGMSDLTWAHKEIAEPQYKVNIFHMNADALSHCHNYFGHELWHNRYNIGVWHWELPEFPDEFCSGFNYVQEVWAPTTYVQHVVSQKANVPVLRIPHSIHVDVVPELNREAFGLPQDRYLFYMMYDLQSTTARKNPQGAIEAFKMAFDKDDPRVGLVLKVNNSSLRPEDIEELRPLIAGHSNIFLIDRVLSRIEVNSLLNSTDCYVSLHRAEGFGLGLAEAMYLGKPVIGTNWSGNTDFMNEENSCPVNFSMVHVGEIWGPYQAHQIWADPDLSQAAGYMRELVHNPEWRNAIAAKGQETIRTQFSPRAVGQMIKQRLKEIGWY